MHAVLRSTATGDDPARCPQSAPNAVASDACCYEMALPAPLAGRNVLKRRATRSLTTGDLMRLVRVFVVLVATLSCSDVSGPGIQGSVTFTYTGAGGGSFSASGDAPSLASLPPTATTWAAGYVEGSDTHIAGSKPRSGGLVDIAILRVERTSVGTATIDVSCNMDGAASCTGMTLFLNFNGNGDSGDFFCGLTSGTIVLTEVSTSRAKGTFSGNGICEPGAGGASSPFSVSNGTFDVALVAPPA